MEALVALRLATNARIREAAGHPLCPFVLSVRFMEDLQEVPAAASEVKKFLYGEFFIYYPITSCHVFYTGEKTFSEGIP